MTTSIDSDKLVFLTSERVHHHEVYIMSDFGWDWLLPTRLNNRAALGHFDNESVLLDWK